MQLAGGELEELVELELHHAWELIELVEGNRDHLSRWLLWVPGTRSMPDIERFIRGTREQREAGRGHVFGIRRGGRLVGCVGLTIDPDDGWGEIGYWLAEDVQGRGTMTRAVRRMIDLAFTELDLPRVEIRCDADNRRSRAIPERLGFTLEGVLRARSALPDGRRSDERLYGLLRDEWSSEPAGDGLPRETRTDAGR